MMTTHKKFKTAILGSTFYGFSRLLTKPEETILIERTSMIGGEFIDSLNEKGGKKVDTQTPFAQAFKVDLCRQNLINDEGEIYSAPALFLFCDYLKKIEVNALFCTEIIQIRKISDGYEITCFNSEGFTTIQAKEIIDTTSPGILHDFIYQSSAQKSLNVVIKAKSPEKAICLKPLIRNTLTRIDIFSFPLALEDDYPSARKCINDFWLNNREALKSCKIVFTANTFAYHMPYTHKILDSNHYWIPSCGFDNLLHAIEEGQRIS